MCCCGYLTLYDCSEVVMLNFHDLQMGNKLRKNEHFCHNINKRI